MPKTLLEYADWLDDRSLIWPVLPKFEPSAAAPRVEPMEGVRGVTWNIYGTLLRIADGELLLEHPQQLRMQIALEKTVKEFNMWNSMTRKPGAPWKYLLYQYKQLLDDFRLAGTAHKGDVPEIDSARIWRRLMRRLQKNGYEYDTGFYGDLDGLGEKVSFFFHSALQGLEASPNALRALLSVSQSFVRQGVIADAQRFTIVQMLRAFREQGTLPPLGDLFAPDCMALSFQLGVRKPSKSLYRNCLERFRRLGIEPAEVLHVSSRFHDDLLAAKQAGMCTALYAADSSAFQRAEQEIAAAGEPPDRVLTDLMQIRDILQIG